MEGGKKASSSSFTDLFGPKESSSSSQGILASIFPPPAATGPQGEALRLSESEKKADSSSSVAAQPWRSWSDKEVVSGEEEEESLSTKEKPSYFPDEKLEPFHYSSSIYYGGQDVYSPPSTAHKPTFNKYEGEDDSDTASRGNWWQGSLYY